LTVPADGTTPEVATCTWLADALTVVDDVALGAYRNIAPTRAAVVVRVKPLARQTRPPCNSPGASLVRKPRYLMMAALLLHGGHVGSPLGAVQVWKGHGWQANVTAYALEEMSPDRHGNRDGYILTPAPD
jgi:hypothetical protein